MRFLALAADYDGTLAHHGLVHATTVATKWWKRYLDIADAFARVDPQRMLRKRNRRSESCERPGLSLQIDRVPVSFPLLLRKVLWKNWRTSCIPKRAHTNAI